MIYAFGECTLDTALFELRRAGRPEPIEPQVYQLLLHLIENRHRLVTREELYDAIWQGRIVTEATLNGRVKAARAAIGDDGKSQTLIRTLPRRGYRFVGTIQEAALTQAQTAEATERPSPESQPRATGRTNEKRLRLVVAMGLAGLAFAYLTFDRGVSVTTSISGDAGPVDTVPALGERSIAVLPFENWSDAGNESSVLVNGMHDELLTQLVKIGSLSVISRTSVMEYRESQQEILEIARDLGVASILKGSIQRWEDDIRVNVQLIDAETAENLWADGYDRALSAQNMFDIQREIATSIADALEARLAPSEIARLGEVPTENTLAYDYYLSGRDYFTRPNGAQFVELAVQQFERAVAEDPNLARAWAALSRAHSVTYLYAIDRTADRIEAARRTAERAVELAPDAPESHFAMAYYHWIVSGNYEEARREMALAERGAPGTAEIHEIRSYIERRAGNWDAAIANMVRAIELDPRNIDIILRQAGNYMHVRDYVRQEQQLDRILDIAPDNASARYWKAFLPLQRDADYTLAKATAANDQAVSGRARLGWLAAIYERDYSLALRYLDAWDADGRDDGTTYAPKASFYGVTYSLAGQPQLAKTHFDSAYDQIEAALLLAPERAELHVAKGEILVGLGDRIAALESAHRAMALMPRSADALTAQYIQSDAITRIIGPAGDADEFIAQLDDYLSAPGDWPIEGLLGDPRLDPVRADPRVQTMIDKYGRK